MSFQHSPSTILGRVIKNEYIALGVFGTTFGTAYLATRGGSKTASRPTTVSQAKESVPVHASSASVVHFCCKLLSFPDKLTDYSVRRKNCE